MDTPPIPWHKQVQLLRLRLNLRVSYVAVRAKIHRNTLADIEAGVTTPRDETLRRLAPVYGVTFEELRSRIINLVPEAMMPDETPERSPGVAYVAAMIDTLSPEDQRTVAGLVTALTIKRQRQERRKATRRTDDAGSDVRRRPKHQTAVVEHVQTQRPSHVVSTTDAATIGAAADAHH